MISHIDHIVLTVTDIEKSVAFYKRVLKMKDIVFANGRRALRFGNQKINLQLLGEETRNHAAVGSGDLCLITEWPIQDVIQQLKNEQIEILEGPILKSGATGQITSVYFTDPDRNLVEVSTYSA
jgi:catechol 2,3-dioxygenase-like lactoylglutathione lyase family enzyme